MAANVTRATTFPHPHLTPSRGVKPSGRLSVMIDHRGREARLVGEQPKVRAGLGRKRLQDIGARMIELRKTAPRKPSQPGALKKVIDAIVA